MPTSPSPQRHPLESLGLLIGLAIAGAVIFTVIALLVAKLVYPSLSFDEAILAANEASIGYLKIVQIAYTIGTFIVPALIFAWLESGSAPYYLKLHKPSIILLLMSIIVLFSIYPLIEASAVLNQKMHFPGFLKEVEEWMRDKETQQAVLIKRFLLMNSPASLALGVLMFAVLPAVGEEVFFRGCLQNTLLRFIKNYHVAIWVTAFIFSAIHFQFYGFLPRMLLGALLGYLYVWGKNIWLPIVAHFANNAFSVIMAFVYQKRGESLDKLDEVKIDNIFVYLISFAITALLLWQYYRISQAQPIEEELADKDGEQLG